MLAFAANSILCRLALILHDDQASIDPASFTGVRLISGALALTIIILFRTRQLKPGKFNPIMVFMLFCYAACFSFAYIELSAGNGALILFGSVQMSMIAYGLFKGEKPGYLYWFGICIAMLGMVYLMLPGIESPPLFSAILMFVAGISWGVYSLAGKGGHNPLQTTAWNFIYTIPWP